MKVIKIEKEPATTENGVNYTGELITVDFWGGEQQTYRAIKNRFTPYGFLRDAGTRYIIAGWSSYIGIDKKTLAVSYDIDAK